MKEVETWRWVVAGAAVLMLLNAFVAGFDYCQVYFMQRTQPEMAISLAVNVAAAAIGMMIVVALTWRQK